MDGAKHAWDRDCGPSEKDTQLLSLAKRRARDSLNSIAFLAHQAIGSPEADKFGDAEFREMSARLPQTRRAAHGTMIVVPSPLAVIEKVPVLLDVRARRS
jgi:hypothetical protein